MARYDVVILPSFAQVEGWRKRRADERASGLFAQAVTTFDAWIADLWELHGDGRMLVGDMQREIIMDVVFSQGSHSGDTPGLAPLAASCMRVAAGVPQFEDALDRIREGQPVEGLSAAEQSFLGGLVAYCDKLACLGLVELGNAAALLARQGEAVFGRPMNVLMPEAGPLTWVQESFFAACPQLQLEIEPAIGAEGVSQAPEGVEVRFAFPSGRLAEPGLVADEVVGLAQAGDIVVACKDPVAMFSHVQNRLADSGLRVCLQARRTFAQTDFGRAFLAMFQFLNSNPWDGATLADVLLSPFSGFAPGDAFKADAAVRADRVAVRDDVLAELRRASELFSQMEELATDPEADVLIGVFEQLAQASAHRSPAWRAEQLAAMGALREATAAARRLNAGIDACVSTLERATVPVSAQVEGSGSAIVFTTLPLAARMQPGCCQALILADLTAEDYPVADRDDAAATLMAKLGLLPVESALSKARRQFGMACKVPAQSLVIMRPLGDDNADSTYPAVALEEFIDAYRADVAATDDIDNAYRLPEALQNGLVERGEELLYANARAADENAEQLATALVGSLQIDDVGAMVAAVAPVRSDSHGNALAKPCPSPSQIESYLECPYQWFVTRRLRIEDLDEGFGPLERGSFAHAALEAFYRQFQAAGHAKVNDDNIDQARNLMRSIVDDLVQAQFTQEPRSGRLVYASELERREVVALCEQLVSFLDFEAAFLPTFHPAYFEYEIDADHAVDYAGYSLVGKVDRIDVDDAGHAVIVDYKGSVNAEHEIAGKDADHAGKVQTRIYAQAVKRALGLDVVGALYVSYGRKPAVSGAYDPRFVEVAHLPGVKAAACGCGTLDAVPDEQPEGFSLADLTFARMLDATEKLAGDAVARMCAGDIVPNPSHAKACDYCPVISCPKRGA